MTNEDLKSVERELDYEFENITILRQAFIRPSYSDLKGGESQDILVWIGKGFLEQFALRAVSKKWGMIKEDIIVEFTCEIPFQEMNQVYLHLINDKTLSEKICVLGFQNYLLMGSNESKIEKDVWKRNADLFRAIIGAVAVDSNWDFSEIDRAMDVFLQPSGYFANPFEKCLNYPFLIQTWSMREYHERPTYIITSFDDSVLCNLYLKNIKEPFRGYGHSAGEAKAFAARAAYWKLSDWKMLYNIRQGVQPPTKENAINQLQNLWFKKYISKPKYDFRSRRAKDGSYMWRCDCYIEEYEDYFWAESHSKLDAKKTAALAMLNMLLGFDEENE